jgi:hypothetical protein
MTDFLLFFINDKNVYILEGVDSKKGGGRKWGRRWEKEAREVTEGWEVGEEKFVKWEKTDPPPQIKCE